MNRLGEKMLLGRLARDDCMIIKRSGNKWNVIKNQLVYICVCILYFCTFRKCQVVNGTLFATKCSFDQCTICAIFKLVIKRKV